MPTYTPIKHQIASLYSEVEAHGWATGTIDIHHLISWSSHFGWDQVSNRRNAGDVDQLVPLTESDARPNSLSAKHGLRRQPLHTDGAHLRRPPDLIALSAKYASPTPTLLWKPGHPPTYAFHGVFLVNDGVDRFLTTSYSMHDGFRYDAGCMVPCDQRARDTAKLYAEGESSATIHEWTSADELLLIDNRRVLHARDALAPDDHRRVLERVSFQIRTHHV